MPEALDIDKSKDVKDPKSEDLQKDLKKMAKASIERREAAKPPEEFKSNEVTVGDRTFQRGETIKYTPKDERESGSEGKTKEYVVLCGTVGDEPGLVLQDPSNPGLVFHIGSQTVEDWVNKMNKEVETDDRNEFSFKGETYYRGEYITYTTKEGKQLECVVLGTVITGEGLILQSVNDPENPNDDHVFRVGKDTEVKTSEPPTPSIEPTPGPPTPSIEPTPGPPTPSIEPTPGPPEFQETLNLRDLEIAISDFANARISKEKMFGGGPEEQYKFDKAETALQEAFYEWQNSLAERINARAQEISNQIGEYSNRMVGLAERMNVLQQNIADPSIPDAEKQLLMQDLSAYQDTYRMYAERIQDLRNEGLSLQEQAQEASVQMMAEIRQRVDAEMVAQREKARPGLSKVADWLKRHPKTRIIAGVAFSAMAITGTVTGVLPLAAIGIAGRSALAGIGVYNASRGVGEMIGNRQMGKADLTTIEGYTEGAEKQSNTRRRSKKVGLFGGAVAAALPVIKGLSSIDTPGVSKPPTPGHSAEEYWYKGIAGARPEAPTQFGNQMSAVASGELVPSPGAVAALEHMKLAREAVIGKLTETQGRNLDLVIGRLSTTPGFGNEVTTKMMGTLAEMTKQGLNANEIISKLPGAGPANIDLAVLRP